MSEIHESSNLHRGLADQAWEFKQQLHGIKSAHPLPGADWYPYDSLGNVIHLEALLDGGLGGFLGVLAGQPIADLGCGDGDMAFFLESLGCTVHAVDHRPSNHNSMLGVRTLARCLDSGVMIEEIDLDAHHKLPASRYGLALLLGVLYHLRHPLHALESLARLSDYCLLSTRVLSRLPSGLEIAHLPMAYLVEADELNADDSNFWMFTDAGLSRLLQRTHWSIERKISVAETGTANECQRVFCLLRSRLRTSDLLLDDGWHALEGNGWRWTDRTFSARLSLPRNCGKVAIILDCFLPAEFLAIQGPLTISIECSRGQGSHQTLAVPGHHTVRHTASEFECGELEVKFRVDKWLEPDTHDKRRRGLIVSALRAESTEGDL